MRRVPGIDFSSGSLGHGLSIGVGMAQAARLRDLDQTPDLGAARRSGAQRGPGLGSGQAASHFELGNICAIVDRNQMGLDGFTEETMTVEPIGGRFAAFGWSVDAIDGHDPAALLADARRTAARRR